MAADLASLLKTELDHAVWPGYSEAALDDPAAKAGADFYAVADLNLASYAPGSLIR